MVRPVVEGLDDRGGRMIARKSGRGLPHYRTRRADACLPAKDGWGTLGAPADGLSARQRTASPRHVAGRGGGMGFLPAGRPVFYYGRRGSADPTREMSALIPAFSPGRRGMVRLT